MKKIYIANQLTWLGIFILSLSLGSCEKELQPSIEKIFTIKGQYETREFVETSFGYPNREIYIDGQDMDDIREVVFDHDDLDAEYNVSALFNPAFNSSNSIMVHVPWEEGVSDFGPHNIIVTNKDGLSSKTPFAVLQPDAQIIGVIPDTYQSDIGAPVEIHGKWFHNLNKVLFGEMEIVDYTVKDNSIITFNMPDVDEGQFVHILTAVDTVTTAQEITPYIGKITLLNDFDGNGVFGSNGINTWPNVPHDQVSWELLDGPTGKFIDYRAIENVGFSVRYNGPLPQVGELTLQKDPEQVFLRFDYNCAEAVGSKVTIGLNLGWTNVWKYELEITETGWQRIVIPFSDFTGDGNPCDFQQVQFNLHGSDLTILQVDNLSIIEKGL